MMVQAFLFMVAIVCFASELALAKPGDVFVLDSAGTKTAKLTNASHTSLELTVDLGDKSQYKPDLEIGFNFTVGSYEFKIRAILIDTDIQYTFDNGKDPSMMLNNLKQLEVQTDQLVFNKNPSKPLNGDKAKFGWDKQTVTIGLGKNFPTGFKLTAENGKEAEKPITIAPPSTRKKLYFRERAVATKAGNLTNLILSSLFFICFF